MRKICVLLILGLLASVAHAGNGPFTWEYNMSTDPVGDGWYVRTPGTTGQYNMTDVVGMMHLTGSVCLDPVEKQGFWLDTIANYSFMTDGGVSASGPALWIDIEGNVGTSPVTGFNLARCICWARVYRDTPTTQAVQVATGMANYSDVSFSLDVNDGFGLGMIDAEITWHTYTGAPIHGLVDGRDVGGKFDYTVTDGTITKSGTDINYIHHTAGAAPNYPTIWSGNWPGASSGYFDYLKIQVGPPIPAQDVGISIENDGPTVIVKYDASASSSKIRGLALDVSLSGGATFAADPLNYSSDFPLAPGSMVISGTPLAITNNGNHLISGGVGTSAAVIEMASLSPSAGDTGTLFEFDVSGDTTVTIGENVAAGGITLENHALDVNLAAPAYTPDITCTGYAHFSDGDCGSPLSPPFFGKPDGKVDVADLNIVISTLNWNINTTDADQVNPPKVVGTADRCADITSPLSPPYFGARDGYVDVADLNIVISVNNWNCPTSVGCTWP